MKEGLRHRQAFDYYYDLGDNRTSQLVANHFTVSRRSVEAWKKAFNWQKRVEQRDIEIARRIEQKTNNAIVNTKADYRERIAKRLEELRIEKGYLTTLYGTAKEKLEKGKLKAETVKDMTDLARAIQGMYKEEQALIALDLKLMGEPDSRGQLEGTLRIIFDDGE